MAKKRSVATQAVEVEQFAGPVVVSNCLVCGRGIRSSDPWCTTCQVQFPAAWNAAQNPVPYMPVLTAPEQARHDLATQTMLQDMFFGPEAQGGLQR